MKYPFYKFIIGWTASFIIVLPAMYLLKWDWKIALAFVLLQAGSQTHNEITKTKSE